jgi:NAD(P)H-quinone oxidoreductase subunit 4
MLRQVFYNSGAAPTCNVTNAASENQGNQEAMCFGTNCILPGDALYKDASPREVFIALCFLVLIAGIGFYPKVATQMYDVKMVAVNAQVRESYTQVAQANPQIYAKKFSNSRIAEAEIAPVLGVLK